MKNGLLKTIKFPIIFVLLIWVVKIFEYYFDLKLYEFGVFPREIMGLRGILCAPFIHNDFTHLLNNSVPILTLGSLFIFFYKNLSFEIFIWLFFISGILLWGIGRPNYHIGASGIIYALATFLFTSGVIKKDTRLAAISLIIAFLYGSLIWGIFPSKVNISWEGHLSGLISGLIVAIFYRNEGPKRKKYNWELEEELDNEMKINYILKN